MFNVFERLNLRERWNCLIVAMSTDRQDIINELKSINKPYDSHICKYILYSNKNNNIFKEHWEREIFDFLNEAQNFRLKSSNKKPDVHFLKSWFFTRIIDDFQSFCRTLDIKERECMKMNPPYPERTKNLNLNKAWILYQKFMDQCAKDMAKGILTLEKVRKYIQPLHTDCLK